MWSEEMRDRALGLLKSQPVRSYREIADTIGVPLMRIYRLAKAERIRKPDLRKYGTKRDRLQQLLQTSERFGR